MRCTAIALTCVLLGAALASPGTAMAKGGNGQHSVATPGASDHGKAQAEKAKAQTERAKTQKPDASKQSRKSAEPKSASPQQGANAKKVEKPTLTATETEKTQQAEKPQSAADKRLAGAPASTTAIPGSPSSAGLDEGRIPSETVRGADVETRGVLDTIRLKANASFKGLRATTAGIWSAITFWLGG